MIVSICPGVVGVENVISGDTLSFEALNSLTFIEVGLGPGLVGKLILIVNVSVVVTVPIGKYYPIERSSVFLVKVMGNVVVDKTAVTRITNITTVFRINII